MLYHGSKSSKILPLFAASGTSAFSLKYSKQQVDYSNWKTHANGTRYLKRKRYGDFGVKFGAIALACFVWFYAANELTYRTHVSIPLHVENPPSGLSGDELTVANNTPTNVKVVVSGRGRDLLRIKQETFLLRVNALPAVPRNNLKIRLLTENVVRNTDLAIVIEEILEPKEIEVAVDRLIEVSVPVIPLLRVSTAESYTQVGFTSVIPDTVRVSGPAKQVRKITSISTDSLVQTDVRKDITRELKLLLPLGARLQTDIASVMVHVDVQELAEYDIPNVPVRIINVGGRPIVSEPSRVTVRVRGGADVIGKLNPETDIDLFVDYLSEDVASGEAVQLMAGAEANYEIKRITPKTVSLVNR